jgi:hypothetical protein
MKARALVKIMDADRRDASEHLEALRLQTRAWRLLTMIALVYPEKAVGHAQWLLFKSVPYVEGPALAAFIAENEQLARECGIKAGVFCGVPTVYGRPA